jgi:hypothetical protein
MSLLRRLLVGGVTASDGATTPAATASARKKSAGGDRLFPCSFCGISSPHLILWKPLTPLTAPPHDGV